jgi:hypothetical protein
MSMPPPQTNIRTLLGFAFIVRLISQCWTTLLFPIMLLHSQWLRQFHNKQLAHNLTLFE